MTEEQHLIGVLKRIARLRQNVNDLEVPGLTDEHAKYVAKGKDLGLIEDSEENHLEVQLTSRGSGFLNLKRQEELLKLYIERQEYQMRSIIKHCNNGASTEEQYATLEGNVDWFKHTLRMALDTGLMEAHPEVEWNFRVTEKGHEYLAKGWTPSI